MRFKLKSLFVGHNAYTVTFILSVLLFSVYFIPTRIFIKQAVFGVGSSFLVFLFTFLVLLIPTCLGRFGRVLSPFFFLVFLIPFSVFSFYSAIYGTILDVDHLYFIWETNFQEASEFMEYLRNIEFIPLLFMSFLIFLSLSCLPFYIFATKPSVRMKYGNFFEFLAISASLIVIGFLGLLKNSPPIIFYNSFLRYNLEVASALDLSERLARDAKDLVIRRNADPKQREIIVIVIGESASRHHMSLYGYKRETSPHMKKLKNEGQLLTYGNVSARFTGTTNSLIHAMSFKDPLGSIATFQYSIVDLFKSAGFKTYWISNNAVMPKKETMLQAIWGNADVIQFVPPKNADWKTMLSQTDSLRDKEIKSNIVYDSDLLPYFREALESESVKKAIFVHLRGSHNTYWYRFPKEFEYFKDQEGIPDKVLKKEKKAMDVTNDYDNSIRYTDFILKNLIEMLASSGAQSSLLYFSDHGEEVFEYRPMYGRVDGTESISKYMLDIPFFVWFSEGYPMHRSLEDLKKEIDRPFSLESLIHTVMDLAAFETPLLDKKKSLFAVSYDIPVRVYQTPQKGSPIIVPYLDIPPVDMYNRASVSDEVKAFETLINRQ